jgi:hypothetical protein
VSYSDRFSTPFGPILILILYILLYILFLLIELCNDKSNSIKFTSLVRELESVGSLSTTKSYPFEFSTEKPYETYSGMNVRLRYFVRVTISRTYNR